MDPNNAQAKVSRCGSPGQALERGARGEVRVGGFALRLATSSLCCTLACVAVASCNRFSTACQRVDASQRRTAPLAALYAPWLSCLEHTSAPPPLDDSSSRGTYCNGARIAEQEGAPLK